VPGQPAFQVGEVAVDELLHQLGDAGTVRVTGHPVGPFLDERERVGHRHPALAEPEEGVVVLRVAHAHAVVRGESQLHERGFEPRGLVHSRGQDHDGALVEDDLELESEVPDGLKHGRLVRVPGRHQAVPHGERRDPAGAERGNEVGGRGFPERLVLSAGGSVDDSAVLGDHAVEHLDLRKDGEQILELPPRHQDDLAARIAKPAKRGHRVAGDRALGGQGSVEVAGEHQVAHGSSLSPPRRARRAASARGPRRPR
jgi:hypothetical protein